MLGGIKRVSNIEQTLSNEARKAVISRCPMLPLMLPIRISESRWKLSPTQFASVGSPAAVPFQHVQSVNKVMISIYDEPVACISTKSTSEGSRPVPRYARYIASFCAEATGALTGPPKPDELIPVPKICRILSQRGPQITTKHYSLKHIYGPCRELRLSMV